IDFIDALKCRDIHTIALQSGSERKASDAETRREILTRTIRQGDARQRLRRAYEILLCDERLCRQSDIRCNPRLWDSSVGFGQNLYWASVEWNLEHAGLLEADVRVTHVVHEQIRARMIAVAFQS